MRTALLVLALAAGCGDNALGPGYIRIVADPAVADDIVTGVSDAWGVLGFSAGTESRPDEVLVVTVTMVPDLAFTPICQESGCFYGHTDVEAHAVIMDAGLHDAGLQHVAAHEVGHAIGFVHVPDGTPAIMNADASWLLAPTEADLAMACGTAGFCERY